jgi:hypothetical protein
MLKLKKISPKNLTNDEVRAYDVKGNAGTGFLTDITENGNVISCARNGMITVDDAKYYIKLSDIDREARKQIKEMNK